MPSLLGIALILWLPQHNNDSGTHHVAAKMISLNSKIHFDHVNPNSEASTDARKELAHLDYAPLPRVTGRSFCMGLLVSMGGFIFG